MKNSIILPCLVLLLLFLNSCKNHSNKYDIVIYGGTSAGVIAAYSAKMEGKSVLLIATGNHLGGLSSSGLGETDIGNKYAVTGLSRNFYRRLGEHYGKLEAWRFEPHVAERIFEEMIEEANVEVLRDYRLKDLRKRGKRIKSVLVEKSSSPLKKNNLRIFGNYFIDCSYEGDLMAKAGVSYIVGRESNEKYGETYNGVQMMHTHQFPDGIDPFIVPGDSSSGLCWGIQGFGTEPEGSGDSKVQAYNYRICLTRDPDNMIPITKPKTYDPDKYELLRRLIRYHDEQGHEHRLRGQYLIINPMPNNKTDINNRGGFSTNAIGMNWDYPTADYDRRSEFAEELKEYTKGLFYFFSSDPDVPEVIRDEMLSWGWPKDEFADNDHFPREVYVREARRMIGEYVMTEHNCFGDSMVYDGIGLAAYTMDSHNVQRVVIYKDGQAMVKNEGNVEIGGFPPYEISYRSLTPKREECENLLVPVCLSASHIAFGSIRMEPVFMVLAQVAALAASLAQEDGIPVQEINVTDLNKRLEADPLQNGTLPDIIVDNSDLHLIEKTGQWHVRSYWMGQNKSDFLLNLPGTKGEQRVRFNVPYIDNQSYQVFKYIPRLPRAHEENITRWANNVPIIINTGDTLIEVNRNMNDHRYDWLPIGSYTFNGKGYVEINAGNLGLPVPADAILLLPVSN